jgi:hypothetical protein
LVLGPAPPGAPPATVAGIPVVTELTSLGIPVVNPAFPPPAAPAAYPTRASQRPPPLPPPPPLSQAQSAVWAARVRRATERDAAIAHLPLSAIGRCVCASTYAYTVFLYHAEFGDAPASVFDFSRRSAVRHAPGVTHGLLVGSPASGGFGLLPVAAHVRARWAAMGCRLFRCLAAPVGRG